MMKRIFFVAVLFLLFSNLAHSQAEVSKNHPFKANTPLVGKQAVKLTQYFNIASAGESSVDARQVSCRYSLNEVRTIGGPGTAGLFEGPLTSFGTASENEITFDFSVAVTQQVIVNPFTTARDTGVFQLPKNWSTLAWKISCQSTGDAFNTSTAGIITRPATESIQEAEVTVNNPMIFSNNPRRIQLEMTSKNVTVGTRLRIIDRAGTVIGEKTEALSFAEPKKIIFAVQRDLVKDDPYTVEIEPSELSEGMINLVIGETSACRPNTATRSRCTWLASTVVNPFRLDPLTLSQYTNLSITAKEPSKQITFTSAVDFENLTVIINRREYPCSKNSRVCVVEARYTDLAEGNNTISFKGNTTYSDFEPPTTALAIRKVPNQPIESSAPPILTVSDKLLKVTYTLRGSATQIRGQLVYAAAPDSTLGTSTTNNCTGAAPKTCEFTLNPNAFANNISPAHKAQKDILVTLVVVAFDENFSEVPLDKLSFKIVNQDFVEKELNKIKETVKDESLAKQAIATLFDVSGGDPATNDMVKQIYAALKDKPSSDRNKVLFGILRGIGNIAVSYFGIPIKF